MRTVLYYVIWPPHYIYPIKFYVSLSVEGDDNLILAIIEDKSKMMAKIERRRQFKEDRVPRLAILAFKTVKLGILAIFVNKCNLCTRIYVLLYILRENSFATLKSSLSAIF